MRTSFFSIVLILLSISFSFAQVVNDNELGLEYFRKGEYEKAVDVYERLYASTGAEVHLNYLVKSFLALSDYKSAAKTLKKAIKNNPDNLKLYVELGEVYKTQGDQDKETEMYEEAVDNIKLNAKQVIDLGEKFINNKEFGYAEKAYLKGRKLFRDYGFYKELARLYMYTHEYEKMINEYLLLVEYSDVFMEDVEMQLQSLIVYDTDGTISDLLRMELLKKIQKSPDYQAYNELLIWLFIQEKRFSDAYTQAVAMDKRFSEDGERVYDLGKLAASNSEYEIAKDCFNYIISKGKNSRLYFQAKKEQLSTRYRYLKGLQNVSKELIDELLVDYDKNIEEFGIDNNTVNTVREYANLLAYYAYRPDDAIAVLNNALENRTLSRHERDRIFLLKADIYVAKDDIWEASLLYAKVEKNNAHSPVGHEAKFKRARVYYFAGEFEYAKAMLDVLKASTSKLIANDAFELSTIINDNTALDTVTDAMKMFARADLLLYQNRDSLALLVFDSIPKEFPGHSLEDEILYKKANIFRKQGDYEKAVEIYLEITERFAYDIFADDACYEAALLYEQVFNNTDKALELYKKIISDHKDSIYVSDARRRYRLLKDKV